MPKITVLMPVYNGEEYLEEAVLSVIQQSFTDFEFIIIDDGSTDRSRSILERYSHQDDRLQVYFRDHAGLVASLNLGLELARGEFIARMDHDDISFPQRLGRQLEQMDRQADLAIVGSALLLIGSSGSPIRVDAYPEEDTNIRWQMLFHCPFAHPTVMLRRSNILRERLFYNPELKHAEDFELWSRLLQHGSGKNIGDPLVKHRLHGLQVSQQAGIALQDAADEISWANLNRLGVHLSKVEIRKLRDWYNQFPSTLDESEISLCHNLLNLLDRFALQPGLDKNILRAIRGRWIIKILSVKTSDPNHRLWKLKFLSHLKFSDLLAGLIYIKKRQRLLRMTTRYEIEKDGG